MLVCICISIGGRFSFIKIFIHKDAFIEITNSFGKLVISHALFRKKTGMSQYTKNFVTLFSVLNVSILTSAVDLTSFNVHTVWKSMSQPIRFE